MAQSNSHQNTKSKSLEALGEDQAFLMVDTRKNGSSFNDFRHAEAGTNMLQEGKTLEDSDFENGTERRSWSRKAEYVLAMVGYCVGLGNVWRFPYVCMRNGGGAFLIPFFICLTLCGMPLFFLEVTLGQFIAKGSFHVWGICPLFKGIGISMNTMSFIICTYYSLIIAWTLIFVVNSFKSPLPWTLCDQEWNTPFCRVASGRHGDNFVNGSLTNGTAMSALINVTGMGGVYEDSNITSNVTQRIRTASEEFWNRKVLELSPGMEHLDGLPWHTAVAVLVANVVVFVCICKGVKSLGKVVYVTATLPYILLTVLIINGATLPGALDGVLFYIKPDFGKLFEVQTWVEASLQVFYSLGPCFGTLSTMASYNKFNNNCMRDAILLSFVSEGTSVYSGFAIFTVLGHMAHTLDLPLANVTSAGPGLAFVVYPEAISYLPLPQLWGVLFFVMLFFIGLDSQFASIETMLTTIHDFYPKFVNKWNMLVKCAFCSLMFLLTLPFATRGGMYYFQLFDWYFSVLTVLLLGILECIIIGWIYGAERLLSDVALMIGRKPSYFFPILWRFVTPTILTIVMLCSWATYKPPVYQDYVYGTGAIIGGWCIAASSFLPTPTYMIYKLLKTEGSFIERIKKNCVPDNDWCPNNESFKEKYCYESQRTPLCKLRLPCSRR